VTDEKIREREVEFAKRAVEKAPQNQCPWNYLRGIAKKSGMPLASLKDFVSQYASVDRPDAVLSSHALDLMADILAEEEGGKQPAGAALDMLAQKYDPIRKNYWEYRKGMLATA
jgi:protein farnesyltransferase/geranylgeranyltransferase type-1 subunit alpha